MKHKIANPNAQTRITAGRVDKVVEEIEILDCWPPFEMATSQVFSSPFLSAGSSIINTPTRHNVSLLHNHRRVNFKIQAAKLPAGVELPKEQPKFQAPFLGFTRTAEIWNSRACMIGIIGTFIVELILNKGILQIIGVEVGKGLDLPL